MRKLIIVILAVAFLSGAAIEADARHKTITTRRGLKVEKQTPKAATEPCDTVILPDSALVRISGYDKPQRSATESLFVSNLSGRNLRGMSIWVTYSDLQGRQLHSARVSLPCDIPAGETRRLYWRAWDRQRSMCYRRSVRSRRSTAALYNISCRIDSAFFLSAHK